MRNLAFKLNNLNVTNLTDSIVVLFLTYHIRIHQYNVVVPNGIKKQSVEQKKAENIASRSE